MINLEQIIYSLIEPESKEVGWLHKIKDILVLSFYDNGEWKCISNDITEELINAETTNRTLADTVLDNRIDAEANTRNSADIALSSALNIESSYRANADTLLNYNIVAEKTRATTVENTIGTSVGLDPETKIYTNTGEYIGKLVVNTVTSDIKALDTLTKNLLAIIDNKVTIDPNKSLVDNTEIEKLLTLPTWDDTLAVIKNNAPISYYNYNIKKTYDSVSSMNADKAAPIGTDELPIKIGDIVTVINSTTPSENGIYSFDGSTNGWKYQSSFNFQLDQTRSQNTNTAPSSKLFDDNISRIDTLRNENKNSILANLLFDFDFSQIIEFNKGSFYINQNGQAIANNNCTISDFIDCTKAKYILPYFYIYEAGYCAYYSAANESSFISSFQVTNSDFGNVKNVPSNANFIRLSAFVKGDAIYKNDYPIGMLIGHEKNIINPIIQKEYRNSKIIGNVLSLQRWGSISGNFIKIKFPDSSNGLESGVSYMFDITIRKLEIDTTSKNDYVKFRVELFRYTKMFYTPNITYISGNVSIIDNIKMYYEPSIDNSYYTPSVVINNSDSLLGIFVDNLDISSINNQLLSIDDLKLFTISENTDINGLTLISDYSDILLNDNIPTTLSKSSLSFMSIDNTPSIVYDSSIFSAQVDPENGVSNQYYRTVYKKIVNGENRLIAKVWGSSPGQSLFRAFDENGSIIQNYSRNVGKDESSNVITLDILLGSDVASYSVSYVVAGSPNPELASLKLLYNIPNIIEDINNRISNGYKYVDINGVKSIISNFKKEINTDHNLPLNLLFVGDSIVNFQNAWNDGETPIYYNHPLCLYNPNTFTNRIWELLNPGALYYDKTEKTYGGAMTFLKTNPIPGNLTPSSGVNISGSWLSNILNSSYNNLGDCGGYPDKGWHEFLFSKTQGDYLEFTVPIGILGFSVVSECSTSNRSYDGTNFYNHSSNAEVYFNGILQGSINTSNKNGNVRFDFAFENATTVNGTIKILLTEVDKWIGVWGIETWSSKHSVRPINNGLASHSIKDVYNKYEQAISSANPDLIIFCGMLNNDSGLTEDEVIEYYDLMWNKLNTLNKPIIGISTHWGTYNRMYYNHLDMNHDDPRHNMGVSPIIKGYHPAYLRIFVNWCIEHNIPLINPCQYMYDNYGDDSTPFLVDGVAHLNVKGHNLYKGLINTAMIGNY